MSSQVIDILTDDDDIIEVTDSSDIVPTKKVSCLNPECKNSNETLMKASDSVKRYYGVEAYYKKRKICTSCLLIYNREKSKVVNLVRQGINIFSNKITLSRKTFIISESDSDDSNLDDSSDDSECEFDVHQIKGVTSDSNNYLTSKAALVKDEDIEELQKAALDIIQSNNLHKQIPDGSNIILERLKNAQAGFDTRNEDFDLIEKDLNVLRNEFYAAFQDDVEYVSPIEIGPPDCSTRNNTIKRFTRPNVNLCNDLSNSKISSSTRHEPISEVTKNPISSLHHTFTPRINPKPISNQKLVTRPIRNSNSLSEIIIIPEESSHVPLSQAKSLSCPDPFRTAQRSISNSSSNSYVPISAAQHPIVNTNNVVNNVPLSQTKNLSYSDPYHAAQRSIANPSNNDHVPVITAQQPIINTNPLSQAKNLSYPDPYHIPQRNIANPINNDHVPVTFQQPVLNANNFVNTTQLINISEESSRIPISPANNCYSDYFIPQRTIANPNNDHVPVTVQHPILNTNNVVNPSSQINISEDPSGIPLSQANNCYSESYNFHSQNNRSYSPILQDETSYRSSESPSETPTQLDTYTAPTLEEMSSPEESNNEIPGIMIVEPTISNELKCLPPVGPLIRHQIRVDEKLYMMRSSKSCKWVEATVINIEFPPNGTECMFGVRFVSEGINEFGMKTVSAKNLAYFNESSVRVPFGTRIIASVDSSKYFYVGIVAEIPTVANKYRYLVFFDDGHTQYVRHSDIRIIAQDSLKVWEDVETRSQSFIKNYLETYPEKTMIRLQKHNFVQTELNGLFYSAQVNEVDCSLAKMYFPVQRKYEWLYRGSSRFQPLFEKKLKYNQKMESETPNLTFRRRTVPVKKKAPVIEYVNLEEPSTDIFTNLEQPNNDSNRNIVENKKLIRKHLILEKKGKKSTYRKDDLEIQNIRFVSHQCNKKCDINSSKHSKSKDVSPLLKPILFGWKRQFTKVLKKTVTRDICLYVAPCGRRLRSYDEICRYLKVTHSYFTIDMFTLDMEINLFRSWEPDDKNFFVEDITCDQEDVYISAVNSIDSCSPKEFKYRSDFIISDSVSVNFDPNYLVCCKCEDNCMNKLKCECWQLTIEAAKNLSKKTIEVNENTGYNYKRLYEQVPSGIFECNPECSCKKSCLNRVVQFPIKQRLQLFKTAQRGWGVRTLNDIPNGTFVCMYVGKVITDTQANQEGRLEGGDEYFANLDYIEIVEEEKDGYESSVTDIEEESDEQSSQASNYELSEDSEEDKKRKRRKSKYEIDKEFKLKTSLNITSTRKRSSRIQHKPGVADDDDSNDSSKRESINFEPDELGDSEILTKVPKKSLRDYYKEAEAQYVLDAKVMGNIGRYLNHSCDPNVYCQNVFVDTHDLRFPRISFFASKNITAGTELTWDYNYEIDSIPNRFKKCYCRTQNCKGRLL